MQPAKFKAFIDRVNNTPLHDIAIPVSGFCWEFNKILRVMQIVLEDCQNKTSFAGLEHFKNLLASSDPEVLVAALETLASVVKINPSKLHINGKLSTVEL